MGKNDTIADHQNAAEELTTEQLFEQLDSLLEQMESETSLEQMFTMYRKGLELTKVCDEKLTGMEQEIKILHDGYDEDE